MTMHPLDERGYPIRVPGVRMRALARARKAEARRLHPARFWGPRMAIAVLVIWALAAVIGGVKAVTLLTLFGFAAAVYGVLNPVVGLFGLGLLTVLDPISRYIVLGAGGLLRWNTFNYWLIVFTLLFLPRWWRLIDIHSSLNKLLLVTMASSYLIAAPQWEPGLQSIVNLFAALPLVIYFHRAAPDDETMYWLGVIMSVAAAVGGLVFYDHPALIDGVAKNSFAMFPLAGIVGACLAFPFASAVRGGQLVLASLAATNVAWVFLSRSRGAMATALIAMAFLLFSARSLAARILYLGAAGLVAMGIAAHFATFEDSATARFDKLFDSSVPLVERTSGRLNLALGGLRMFLEHPLGVGTGAFENTWAEMEQPETSMQWQAGKFIPPHSAWVMILAENGLPGILLLGGYVVSFALVSLKRREPYLRRIGLFTTVLLAIAFVTQEFQGKVLWFAAAGATTLLHQRAWRRAARRVPVPAGRRGRAARNRRRRPLATPVPADA